VVYPSDDHAVVQRIEERDSLTFASLHKELTRKVLSVVHGKGDCGATNQCRATAYPASLGSDVCVVVVCQRSLYGAGEVRLQRGCHLTKSALVPKNIFKWLKVSIFRKSTAGSTTKRSDDYIFA
jgi:hypothetical protein